jgi:hypothetical protein
MRGLRCARRELEEAKSFCYAIPPPQPSSPRGGSRRKFITVGSRREPAIHPPTVSIHSGHRASGVDDVGVPRDHFIGPSQEVQLDALPAVTSRRPWAP